MSEETKTGESYGDQYARHERERAEREAESHRLNKEYAAAQDARNEKLIAATLTEYEAAAAQRVVANDFMAREVAALEAIAGMLNIFLNRTA